MKAPRTTKLYDSTKERLTQDDGSGANREHERCIADVSRRLQAASTAFQTAGAARP
jgi:hypothetical protein